MYLSDYELILEILIELGVSFTRIQCNYGWLGNYIPNECFLINKYVYILEDGTYQKDFDEWSLDNLQERRVMSDDLILCETKDNGIQINRIHCVVQIYTINTEYESIGLYDMAKNKLLLFKNLKILKCISFDKNIRAVKCIEKHWLNYQKRKLESRIRIQRFVIHYLYKPGGPMMKKLKSYY